jgi:hypothetical protein
MTDAMGLPLHFDTIRDNVVNRYHVYLNNPVPPSGDITINMEGAMTDLIHPTGNPGEFVYHMDHSPGYLGITRRIETHRLPPGAELISKSPDDLKVMHAGDHIELFIDRRIPPGGDIDIRYRYRLEKAPTPNPRAELNHLKALEDADQTLGTFIKNKDARDALAWMDDTMMPDTQKLVDFSTGTELEPRALQQFPQPHELMSRNGE